MTPERVILYHAGCDDGFGAAWAAWLELGERAEYIAVQYGAEPPKIRDGAHVTILDFSYPRDVLLAMRERCLLHILDHHKTAAADLAGLDFALFDMDKSGARLAWEHFHPGKHMPALLAAVEDRDLWRFALSTTKEITSWLRSWPREFWRWSWADDQVREDFNGPFTEGAAIMRANAQHVDAHVRNAKMLDVGGARVPCTNATMLQSEIGAALNERHPDAPFSATYFDMSPGTRVWSLRTQRDDVDASTIAKHYGGGGHRGAAGFRTQTDVWPSAGPISAPAPAEVAEAAPEKPEDSGGGGA